MGRFDNNYHKAVKAARREEQLEQINGFMRSGSTFKDKRRTSGKKFRLHGDDDY